MSLIGKNLDFGGVLTAINLRDPVAPLDAVNLQTLTSSLANYLENPTALDASLSPAYPVAANIGETFYISADGTVGGDSFQTGDLLIAIGLGGTSADYLAIQTKLNPSSETEQGKIEIATQAEVDAGIDDERAITPLKLAAYIAANVAIELKSYSLPCARNANISSNQALRRQNGTFISNNPYIIPYDSILTDATAENNPNDLSDNWDLEVEVNGIVVLSITVPGGDHKVTANGLNIAVSSGDEVVIFFRNASGAVNRPGGVLYFKEVPTPLNGKQSYNFNACRNSTINSDQALRRQNGTFISNCPYIVPFNSVIYAITAENNPNDASETWDLDVEVNGSSVTTLSVPISDHKVINNNLDISVNQGDEIVIFFRNSSGGVNNPGGIVYLLES